MKLTPILTEKSLELSKDGKYTFWVLPGFSKNQIKTQIEKVFEVHVTSIKTLNYKGGEKRNFRGQKVKKASLKKAIVTLKDKEKIDLFESKKGS